ncbi:37S ribosomal protein S24, mitochondrial [Cryptotrichosporon argae]
MSRSLLALRPLQTASTSLSRGLASSAPAAAASGRDRNIGDWDMQRMPEFAFDDATSLGHLRLQRLDEVRSLIQKVDADRAVLKAQTRKFKPPTAPIRLTSTIDLADPTSAYHTKRVLVVAVARLPLKTAAAAHRLKLLAGPRWTPGPPGAHELDGLDAVVGRPGESAAAEAEAEAEADGGEGRDGWIKIAEERFRDARMNRKSVSDMLERLVEAANDPDSPLPADTPLDPRHLLARQRKKRQRAGAHHHARAQALAARPAVGGVRGFPAEWLAPRA